MQEIENNEEMQNNIETENQEENEQYEYGVYLNLIKWELIPDINLYSEQVVQIINESLSGNVILGKNISFTKSYITPTMINNYVKIELIEPPENKRYTREQIAKLLVISLLKQVYTTDEIIKFLEITYAAAPLQRAYTSFIRLLRESLRAVFLESELINDGIENTKIDIHELNERQKEDQFVIETKEQSLLKNVTLSIANKIYVEEYLANLDLNNKS